MNTHSLSRRDRRINTLKRIRHGGWRRFADMPRLEWPDAALLMLMILAGSWVGLIWGGLWVITLIQ